MLYLWRGESRREGFGSVSVVMVGWLGGWMVGGMGGWVVGWWVNDHLWMESCAPLRGVWATSYHIAPPPAPRLLTSTSARKSDAGSATAL